ncbi:SAM-dependent methyltransferase [Paenibacillus turpanensis]|uniref:SAM-dependent methyltransferase n=1 Tax=Paenibacillus turpanensis TaxID=2689078 RepID=UPI00140C9F03
MSSTNVEAASRWISTSNRGSAVYALEEWRRLFPGARGKHLVPSEVLIVEVPLSSNEVLKGLKAEEPVFVRHVQPVLVEVPVASNVEQTVREALDRADLPQLNGQKTAVQVRRTEKAGEDASVGEWKASFERELTERYGMIPTVNEAAWIVSVFVTEEWVWIGCSTPDENLSDWPGGAIRFRREEGLISRAKFKLLEAEVRFGLKLDSFSSALDIGAAPGGWTSLLLERDLQVTAVDPGQLDASLLSNPRLTYLRKNAADVKFREGEFDLLVCDMSWSPRQMQKLIKELLYSLQAGGTAIITLKLMHGKPFQTIREAREAFGSGGLTEVGAKQLFHNRDELTMIFRKG